MTSVIIGASGQIGRFLRQASPSRSCTGLDLTYPPESGFRLDITRKDEVDGAFGRHQPRHVFLTAALTHVDFCEERPEEARRINVLGTQNVVEACKAARSKLIFFSSEYVFDGNHGPYREEDFPSPVSVYGKTKWESEKTIADSLPDYLIVRTTVVYSYDPEGKNFLMQLQNRLGSGQRMRVASDQWSHPTYAPSLAEIVWELVLHGARGIYHVVGPDYLSRYQFAQMAARNLGLDPGLLEPVPTYQLQQKAPRPLKAGLLTDKLKSFLGHVPIGVQEALLRIQQEIPHDG